MDYKESGVDIELGNDASKILYNAAKVTWGNRENKIGKVVTPFDNFSGLRMVDVSMLPEGSYLSFGFDGIGTKVDVAERIGKHDTAAYDLFAMVCDDAVVRGGEPALVGSVLDVNHISIDIVKDLAKGYITAAEKAGVAIINGEIAELGARVSGYGEANYNWSAGLIWFAKKERLFTGYEIKEGDKVIALREKGFRSNGLTLARKILERTYGEEWHKHNFQGENLGDMLLAPSRIYSKTVCKLFGGFSDEPMAKIHGIAHITGGGIFEKLGRVLEPSGLGAELNNLYEPCKLMEHLIVAGDVSGTEAYKTWNMGQGMLIILPVEECDKVIEIVENDGIEAKVSGTIDSNPQIRIIT